MGKISKALPSPVIASVRTAISSAAGDTITLKKSDAEAIVTAHASAKKESRSAAETLELRGRAKGAAAPKRGGAMARASAAAEAAAAEIRQARASAK